MNNLPKLIRRFTAILLLGFVLLVFANFAVFAFLMAWQWPSIADSPYNMAIQTGKAFQTSENRYTLQEDISLQLKEQDIWAFVVDNDTLQIVWKTENVPDTIPASYSLSDIADLSVGYLDGYPTYTGKTENGIVVLGYPKDSFWKHTRASWNYNFVSHFPQIIFLVLVVNIAIILLIYVVANMKFLKPVKPITKGIQDLSVGEPVHIPEKGLLSDISANINRTSNILQEQRQQLKKKETARANWIAGVSHDIRTPLSMVMGYAGQLKDDANLTDEERQMAEVIVKQSERMKNLINDLNLASKLEYNMQPVNLAKQNLIAIVRQVVVDFINMDIEDKYPIAWQTDEVLTICPVNADKDLLKRAVSNLIQNSINHNEQGCKIYVCVMTDDSNCTVVVADNGVGATNEQIEKLNNAPHYMVCDNNTTEQRHGLGLLIVKQIVAAHGGITTIEHSSYGGFLVKLTLPMLLYRSELPDHKHQYSPAGKVHKVQHQR